MNAMDLFLSSALAQAIGWALLHLLWQGTLIAGITAALFALMRERSAAARYLVGCVALAVMLAFPLATAWRVYERDAAPVPASAATRASMTAFEAPASQPVERAVAIPLTYETIKPILKQKLEQMFRPVVPWTFSIWLAGVLVLSARFAGGWVQANRLCRRALEASAYWQRRLESLSDRMNLTTPLRLLESRFVDVPMVVGWLRPVVIMPVTALTGLTAQQLETILAHELAHIRRNDYLVNLLQGVVETLLFYHPAVWWLSRRIRIERENCCDDLAVAVCGNPVLYARALTDLEELRTVAFRHALAANGGSLKSRIVRLIVGREGKSRCSYRWITGMSVFTAAALLLVVAPLSLLASKHTLAPTPPPAPKVVVAPPAPPAPPTTPKTGSCKDSNHAHAEIDVTAPRIASLYVGPGEGVDAADFDVNVETPDIEVEIPEIEVPDLDIDIDPEIVVTPELEKAIARAVSAAHAVEAVRPVEAARVIESVKPVIETIVIPRVEVEALKAAAIASAARVEVIDARTFRIRADGKRSRGDRERLKAIKVRTMAANEKCTEWDGELTVDQLVALRQAGVDPKFVEEVRAQGFDKICFEQIIALRNNGVTASTIAKLRAAGIDDVTASQLIQLTQQGVTPEYIKAMRDAGYDGLTTNQLVSMRIQGVDPAYVKAMRDAGYTDLTPPEIIALRIHGVDAEFAREIKRSGYDDITAAQLMAFRIHGIDSDYVRSMREAGVARRSPEDLIRMRNLGVDAAYIRSLERAGYTSLSAAQLGALRNAGVDPEFIASLKKAGYEDLSVNDLIRLRNNGVDPEYLRDLTRARK
jgi:beta-lactamase regulating signal transducer with metallopeptidase domain